MLRLGTRGSPLALAQAHMTAAALADHGVTAEIVTVSTQGDRVQDRPLAEIGGKALWTKELDAALLDGRIDIAVHSMKDVETQLGDGIRLAAMLPRADVRERLVGAESIAALPPGARVGTSSPRRAAQLRARRPDLQIDILRGNVATRLAAVESGAFDATLLAAAGLDRLGITAGVAIETEDMLPASAQGAVGITARDGDAATLTLLAGINDTATFDAVSVERAFLAGLGGTCHSPVAALARVNSGRIEFLGEILSEDGREVRRGGFVSATEDAADIAASLAQQLLAKASPGLRALFQG